MSPKTIRRRFSSKLNALSNSPASARSSVNVYSFQRGNSLSALSRTIMRSSLVSTVPSGSNGNSWHGSPSDEKHILPENSFE